MNHEDTKSTTKTTHAKTAIKICGVRDVEMALHAAQAGADFVGLVFVERSPRFVTPAQATKISHALMENFPGMGRVGLFCDSPTDEVKEIAEQCGLTAVQLHGHESRDDVECLENLAVWKAVPFELERIEPWRDAPRNVEALLIDAPTKSGQLTGGTGEAFDWKKLSALDRAGLPAIVLAGGLTPGNVGEAIRVAGPWGVDVSSGVEVSRGVKDPKKVTAFVDAVRAAWG